MDSWNEPLDIWKEKKNCALNTDSVYGRRHCETGIGLKCFSDKIVPVIKIKLKLGQ